VIDPVVYDTTISWRASPGHGHGGSPGSECRRPILLLPFQYLPAVQSCRDPPISYIFSHGGTPVSGR